VDNQRANGPIRVLIADDHEVFRHGLEQALGGEVDIDVIGEAVDGATAVDQALALAPDVLLLDVRMPELTGIEAAARIHTERPEIKIIMLTGASSEVDLFAAVRAGASGYLLKEVSIEALADAVRAVTRGDGLLAPPMVAKLMRAYVELARRLDDGEQAGRGAPRLTDRELEVLRLVARGMSNKEIALQLVIAQNTVKNHVRNILEKLRLRSRTEAAMYAVRENLIEAS
jgi:DNA-binding NarL/FixJ family response regulator